MSKITAFKNIYEKNNPYPLTIEQALERVRVGKSKEKIEEIRNTKDKDKASVLKNQLPSICFSGEFANRSDDALIKHSGYIVLDFDDVGIDELRDKQTEIISHNFVYACWVSPRGNGLKALVKVADGKKHAEHFDALRELFPEIDKSGRNVSRVCFESYDPDVYVNKKAVAFTKTKRVEKIEQYGQVEESYEKFKRLMTWLTNRNDAFVKGERNLFIFKLASACCRFGIEQDETIHFCNNEFLANDNTFTRSECENAIRSAYKSNKMGTAIFEKDVLVDKVTRGEIVLNADIYNTDIKPKDVIYAEDVREKALSLYHKGYESVDGVFCQELDNHFKLKRGEMTLISGIGNYGKALDIDTEIPTPNGYVKMGDIKIGDVVYDENGKECNVVNATDVMYGRTCYEVVFNDGTKVIADENHQWLTIDAKARNSHRNAIKNNRIEYRDLKNKGVDQTHKRTFPSVKNTKEISETLIYRKRKNYVEYNHHIQLCKPVYKSEKQLPIHPYILGAWIGDGAKESGGFSSNDYEIVQNILDYGYNINKIKSKYGYYIRGIKPYLRQLNVFKNKHIPIDYMNGSIEQRLDLLRGLMDTDGHNSGYCYEFTTIIESLAQQVAELVASLGIKCTTIVGNAKLNGVVISKKYRVTFYTDIRVFNLSRKHKDVIKYKATHRTIIACNPIKSRPVRCIEVDSPSHLFLCTRSYIPTHNSAFMKWYLLLHAIHYGRKFALFPPEDNPTEEFYHDLVEILLGADCTNLNPNKPTEEEYNNAYSFVGKHFFYIFPKEMTPTPEYIKERFLELIIKEKVDGCVIDPFNQMTNDYASAGGRDDKYLEAVLGDFDRFAVLNSVYFIIIAHPKTMHKDKNGGYPCPDVFDLSGGAMWNNKMYNILIYHRPNHHTDPHDPVAEIHTKKIKRQKVVGRKGTVDMRYNRMARRFIIDGLDVVASALRTMGINFKKSDEAPF